MILMSLGLGTNRINSSVGKTGPVTEPPMLIFQDNEPAKLYFIQGDSFPIILFVRKD